MVDAIVSAVLDQLVSSAIKEAKEQLRLVTGVDRELENLKCNFQAIQDVLVDAEQRQHKDGLVRLWLDELKIASYEMEDVLDEWITASVKRQIKRVDENALISHMKKVCPFFPPAASCFGFKRVSLRRHISLKIKSINQTVDEINKRKNMFNLSVIIRSTTERSERIPTTSFINVSGVCGRDKEMKFLKSMLLCESSEQQNSTQIISIIGMGGIGKTTLARLAFNDKDVINNFEKRIWVCVSESFNELRIAKAILEALEDSTPNLGEFQALMLGIHKSIAGKKFFLVLDDVWTEDQNKWEPFHDCLINGGNGSKILVTTRNESVAKMMESVTKIKSIIVNIRKLSEQDCWSLFEQFAFSDRSHPNHEQLEKIGRNIVDKCEGLPLAAKTIGSFLRFKTSVDDWQSVLDSELWQLEDFEKSLSPSLLLSYNDLPYKIKQCFLYCAVFPKDYDIEKDELIKLWMAHDYIKPEGTKEMEMIGEEYFNYLASRSFFQEFSIDDKGNVIGCSMHDVVHDFAQFLTKDECTALLSGNLAKPFFELKLRHLMLVLRGRDEFPVSVVKAKKLRSLLIDGGSQNENFIGPYIFDQLTCLRTLKIVDNWSSITEIPEKMEKLTHLRYLKLEELAIEKLPERCCELFNLQTLEMVNCNLLKELPQGIGKLVNLRHLIFDTDELEYMPKGIERLTCLRTLSRFVGRSLGVDGSRACKLEGLRHLIHLRGSIRIELYGNVRNIDEAKNADLEKKKNILDLELDFRMDLDENGAEYEAICEALRPPQNLESLTIENYEAKTRWPNWIESLHKLKKLSLEGCHACEIMPPLGKLPSLEMLQVWGLGSVKRVGAEFLGIEEERDEEVHGGCGGTSSSVMAFPKLKQLKLFVLDEWEEWDFGKTDIAIMPQLMYLRIRNCKKLKSLPEQLLECTTLKELDIEYCPILKERFTGEDWPKISHIPNILIDHLPPFYAFARTVKC